MMVLMPASKPSPRRVPRRRLPLAEKRRIVELSLRVGTSVRAVAREQGVNRNSLYQWQALYRAGKLGGQPLRSAGCEASDAVLLPVSIAAVTRGGRQPGESRGPERTVVQVMLASGAVMRIETDVLDVACVSAVLAELRQ